MSSPADVPLNQILFGPPGTGKTYSTIDRTLEILDPELVAKTIDHDERKRRFDVPLNATVKIARLATGPHRGRGAIAITECPCLGGRKTNYPLSRAHLRT